MPETTTPPPTPAPETEATETPGGQPTRASDTTVPHITDDSSQPKPLRISSGRYSALEEHELVRLLDSIEDERARARFRESVYISIFVYMLLALVVLYGPKYLWHAPHVILPEDVLKQREVTRLEAPVLHRAPRPAPPIDSRTLDRLRSANPPRPVAPAPRPAPTPAPAPTPVPEAKPATPAPRPVAPTTSAPAPALPPPTAAPNVSTPSRPAAPLADAPRPQPSSRPNFSQPNTSAGSAVQQAIQDAARNRGSGGSVEAPSGRGRSGPLQGGMEVLSDTQGVDFNPYLARIKRMIEEQWYPLIPEEAQPPLSKSGVTLIRFTINADGSMTVSPHIDDSTGDKALNKAAWGSIIGVGQFPPLPKAFHGPNLELRFGFYVNRQPDMR